MFSHDRRTPTLTLSMLALHSAAIVQMCKANAVSGYLVKMRCPAREEVNGIVGISWGNWFGRPIPSPSNVVVISQGTREQAVRL